MAYARDAFRLALRPTGAPNLGTMADHQASFERQTGRPSAAVENALALPELAAHIWAWFLELSARRGGSGFGPLPLRHGDVRDWMAVTGRILTQWEVQVVMRLDDTYLTVTQEAK